MLSFHAVFDPPTPPTVLRLRPKLVRQMSASSLPRPSIHASPSGSVIVSLCSWLRVEIDGSAVLELGRGLFDWQWLGTALYGMIA